MTGFRPATRSEAKPLIGLYSESGCGKTWSALLLMRGALGPDGIIGMIETEGGRGEAYVGRPPVGNYLVRPIRQVFSPQEYGKAITEAEQAGLGGLIIDSASHEWEGAGGVLAMAAANESAGKKGVLVWQQPKIEHQRHFMLRLMQTPIPYVVVCMRAKYPMEQKGSNWVRSTVLEPKQSNDILFEMFVHGWIDDQHRFHATKYTVPELAGVIRDNEPIGIHSGKALAEWAAGSNPNSSSSPHPTTLGDLPSRGGGGHGEGDATLPASGEASPSSPSEEDDSTRRFVDDTHERIRKATNYKELGEWWNSPEQQKARRDFLDPSSPELARLKAFVTTKLEALKPKA